MSDQFDLTLSGQAPQNWRTSDPQTSREAGLAAARFCGEHQRLIYSVLKASAQPMAAEQIADELGWTSHVPVNRRLSELEDGGMIRAVDSNYHNRQSGRAARRFVISP
jgi:predicted ArsR family transcriptional regulator